MSKKEKLILDYDIDNYLKYKKFILMESKCELSFSINIWKIEIIKIININY